MLLNMKNHHAVISALLLATTLAITVGIYWSSLDGPFLLDDRHNVQASYLKDADWDALVYVATHNKSGPLGRPVSVASFTLSGLMHGPDTWGYKYHNLMIHLFCGLLIFWLFLRILPELNPDLKKNKEELVAGFATAVWLTHPLMVSTVLYVVQRMAQLSTLFTLAALLVYVIARQNIIRTGVFILFGWLLFPLLMLLAVLSKETGALIPLYVLTMEFIVFRNGHHENKVRQRLLWHLLVFVGVPLVVGSYYLITHFDQFTNYSMRSFTLYERLLTQLHVVIFYLKLIFFPKLSDMSLFHDDIAVVQQFDWLTLVYLLVLIVAVFAVFYLRRSKPVASFAIAWFLVSHLMESTFISLELVFEHRNYLALASVALFVSHFLVVNLPTNIRTTITAAVFFLLSSMTLVRAQEWRDQELFYRVAVEEHPSSPRAHTEYANLLFAQGNLEGGFRHLDIAGSLNNHDYGYILHKMVFLCGSDEPLDTMILEANDSASINPATPYSLAGMEALMVRINKGECPEVSFAELLSVVQVASQLQANRNIPEFLGYLQHLEGKIRFMQGDVIQGIRYMLMAYESSKIFEILIDLVDFLIQLGYIGDAEFYLSKMEEINNESLGIHQYKILLLRQGIEDRINDAQ